jgi:hypothetical protein
VDWNNGMMGFGKMEKWVICKIHIAQEIQDVYK